MRYLRLCLAMLAGLVLSGCYFQSDVLLAGPDDFGDPVVGIALGESLVRARDDLGDFPAIGTLTAETNAAGAVRYRMVFSEDGDVMRLKALTLGDGRYLLRYTEVKPGAEAESGSTGLVFLIRNADGFDMLTHFARRETLDAIFAGASVPRPVAGEHLDIASLEQADRIAAYFADHIDAFDPEKDFSRLRFEPKT